LEETEMKKRRIIFLAAFVVLAIALIAPPGVAAESQAPDIIFVDTTNPGKPTFHDGGDPNTPGPDVVVILPDKSIMVHP
jgi:hypothetical protein